MISFLKKRKNKELKPVTPMQRYTCPFYGFHMGYGGIFMDNEGNQCALITGSYSPCKMKIMDQTPDFNKCELPFRIPLHFLEEIINVSTIFPIEFRPKEKSKWDGIPFKDWWNYVMTRGANTKQPLLEAP